MNLLEVSPWSTDGSWGHAVLEVGCSAGERDRLHRLSDVLHPELHVVRASDVGGRSARTADECVVHLLVAYPRAHVGRLGALLEGRLREAIPGLDIGRLQEAG
jgi:hypothetical protein